jgi:hypothetical protein
MNTLLRRTIHPQTRVLDAKAGTVEYVASDESLDSFQEVIIAGGWRFNRLPKNAPFVDSHRYDTIASILGKIVSYEVVQRQLVEIVEWAKDVAENSLAQLGWKMTLAGFPPPVSVGFWPVKSLWAGEDGFGETLKRLNIPSDSDVRRVYLEQEQIELSAVVLGANPNAVARCYKSGAFTDADLETISQLQSKRETANPADDPAVAELARQRAREEFLRKFQQAIHQL